MRDGLTERRFAVVREYFRRVDAGDAAIDELYTDDVELYFPKFGLGRGRAAAGDFAARLGAHLNRIEHDIPGLLLYADGDRVIAEGTEGGVSGDGVRWPDGIVSTGRFCNVFTFRGMLISAVHIYVDPDFTGEHEARIRQLTPPALRAARVPTALDLAYRLLDALGAHDLSAAAALFTGDADVPDLARLAVTKVLGDATDAVVLGALAGRPVILRLSAAAGRLTGCQTMAPALAAR